MARGQEKKAARVSDAVEVAKVRARTERWLSVVPWVGRGALLALSWLPLTAVQPMIEDFAGKHTTVSMGFSFSFVANLLIGGAYFVERGKNKRDKAELQRLRARQEAIDEMALASKRPARKSKS